MTFKGSITDVQIANKKRLQPDSEFEFLDSIISNIIHADPECYANLSITEGKMAFHVTPSNSDFKQSIINNLVKLNSLLKIKIIFSSSLKISTIVSFKLELS